MGGEEEGAEDAGAAAVVEDIAGGSGEGGEGGDAVD